MAFSRFLSTLLVSSLFLASASKRGAEDQLSKGVAKRARKNPFEVDINDDGSVLPTYDETFQQSLGPLLYAPGRVTRSQKGQVALNNASVVSTPVPAEELPEKPSRITIRIKAPEPRPVAKKCPRPEFVPREETPAAPTKITIKIKPQSRVAEKFPRYPYPRFEDVTEEEEESAKQESEESSETHLLTPSVSSDPIELDSYKIPTPRCSIDECEMAPADSDDIWYLTPGRYGPIYDSDTAAANMGTSDYSSPFTTPSTPLTPGCYSEDEAHGFGMESMAWTDIDHLPEIMW